MASWTLTAQNKQLEIIIKPHFFSLQNASLLSIAKVDFDKVRCESTIFMSANTSLPRWKRLNEPACLI